ncbi:hypothetical protein P7K49_035993 [Saguinus oedipus]|uniref:Uncharacterized protein n=1 Tax=Saguinus oedipus TaxID=9490 RepID=A0ABQ9TP86_SAGOE|nr:hypothetical protein P7K49_035993 [Saguinus oedipus]
MPKSSPILDPVPLWETSTPQYWDTLPCPRSPNCHPTHSAVVATGPASARERAESRLTAEGRSRAKGNTTFTQPSSYDLHKARATVGDKWRSVPTLWAGGRLFSPSTKRKLRLHRSESKTLEQRYRYAEREGFLRTEGGLHTTSHVAPLIEPPTEALRNTQRDAIRVSPRSTAAMTPSAILASPRDPNANPTRATRGGSPGGAKAKRSQLSHYPSEGQHDCPARQAPHRLGEEPPMQGKGGASQDPAATARRKCTASPRRRRSWAGLCEAEGPGTPSPELCSVRTAGPLLWRQIAGEGLCTRRPFPGGCLPPSSPRVRELDIGVAVVSTPPIGRPATRWQFWTWDVPKER